MCDPNWILHVILSQGKKNAVIYNGDIYSYSQLYEQINAYYEQVKNDIPAGKIVTIVADYNFESIALFFALYANKNIVVPVTTKVLEEIENRIEVSSSDFVITFTGNDLSIRERKASGKKHKIIDKIQNNNNSGLILFSSGTTGAPKAMVHNLDHLIYSFQGRKKKKLIFLVFLMFDHIGGLNTMFGCIAMGATMVFPVNRNTEDVCSLIHKYGVHILPTSPTFLNLILISESYKRYDLSSIKMITYGTEPMPHSLLLKLKKVFPRVKFLQTFGTSETGISQALSRSSSSTFIKLDDSDVEYKVVNNELWLKSRTQILGYLNASMERFTEDGWFKTGDLVEESGDGYIKIVGREKEVINVGGEKVLPSEVESILYTMPNVKYCLVYGESNPIVGQMVVAKILFNEGVGTSSHAKELVQNYCQDKLERYKIPVKILLMKEAEYSDRFKKKRI